MNSVLSCSTDWVGPHLCVGPSVLALLLAYKVRVFDLLTLSESGFPLLTFLLEFLKEHLVVDFVELLRKDRLTLLKV